MTAPKSTSRWLHRGKVITSGGGIGGSLGNPRGRL